MATRSAFVSGAVLLVPLCQGHCSRPRAGSGGMSDASFSGLDELVAHRNDNMLVMLVAHLTSVLEGIDG